LRLPNGARELVLTGPHDRRSLLGARSVQADDWHAG
jgi:hypothetical protein